MPQEKEKSPNPASSSQNSSGLSTRPQSRSSSTCSDAAIRKKKKVNEPNLPWVTHNKLLGVELRPKLHATLKLLWAWSINPKQVKASIISTPGCPVFPNSEWLNLIQSKTVNLDNIFQDSIQPPLIIKEQNPMAKLNSNLEQKMLQNSRGLGYCIQPRSWCVPIRICAQSRGTQIVAVVHTTTLCYQARIWAFTSHCTWLSHQKVNLQMTWLAPFRLQPI